MTDRPPVIWNPNPGPQDRFLRSSAFEVLYGGQAGGGKSDALMVAPLRWVSHPSFNALLLRQTFAELEETLVARSQRVYSAVAPGARYNASDHIWRFPSGARIRFGYLERDEQVLQYQGAEFQYLGWDELTHFSEHQYRYLLSRVRGTAGLPKRIRAGSNPGGPGHEWVQKRWGPWLAGTDWDGPRAESGESLWYVNEEHGERWCDQSTPGALSRTFIRASIDDNPKLDPGYKEQLMGLDVLTRAQLLRGDWMARPAPGLFFRREWFPVLDAEPEGFRWLRWWDRAATEADPAKKNDPDWTIGLKLGIGPQRQFCVGDVVRLRGSPGAVKAKMLATAERDTSDVFICGAQDPGAAGVAEVYDLKQMFKGYRCEFYPESGDKVVRAGPASAQCEPKQGETHGNVSVVRADWNDPFFATLEIFPTKGQHDDDVDAFSGAYSVILKKFPAPAFASGGGVGVRSSVRG